MRAFPDLKLTEEDACKNRGLDDPERLPDLELTEEDACKNQGSDDSKKRVKSRS